MMLTCVALNGTKKRYPYNIIFEYHKYLAYHYYNTWIMDYYPLRSNLKILLIQLYGQIFRLIDEFVILFHFIYEYIYFACVSMSWTLKEIIISGVKKEKKTLTCVRTTSWMKLWWMISLIHSHVLSFLTFHEGSYTEKNTIKYGFCFYSSILLYFVRSSPQKINENWLVSVRVGVSSQSLSYNTQTWIKA